MFQRTPKSSRVAEPSARAGFGYAPGLRVEHLQAWRDAAKEVRSTYRAWCTAGRRDSRRLHMVFLDALRYEELAARQVERDASLWATSTTSSARRGSGAASDTHPR